MKASAPPRFKPNEVVVALLGFAYHPYGAVRAGTRLRADHEAVIRNPAFFIGDGSSDDERAKALFALTDSPISQDERMLPANLPKPLADEDLVLCIAPVGRSAIGSDGVHQRVEVGRKISKRHPYVKVAPDAFVDVCNGVPRERALLCVQTLRNGRVGPDGETVTETLYAGQWADLASPWVKSHPTMFRAPDPVSR